MAQFSFYIRQDGTQFGPYSIDEVRNLGLLDDTEVLETSVGEWYPASYYDFDELYMKEHGYNVGADGGIHRGGGYAPSQERNVHSPSSGQVNISIVNQGGSTHETPGTSTPHPSNPTNGGDACPESAKGWSWGAFFFSWIWGVFNNVYWPLIMIPLVFVPIIGQIANFVVIIILGVNGREMAWKGGHWRAEDVEEFNSKQSSWAKAAGWIIFIGIALIAISSMLGR